MIQQTDNLKCILCRKKALHGISYTNFKEDDGWKGHYCNSCFIKKLRAMATAWSNRK